ncbi:MAG: MFS transporter, partial [Myxococcota bacterium]
MAFIDTTVVNIALPAMQREFDVGLDRIQWVIETYSLFLSALVLLGGSLADRFGRRRLFMLGTVSFAVASVLCAVAPDLWTLNIARSLQGIGAALLVPSSLALISASFPASHRGTAIATWTAFGAITTALGPPLGGLVVEYSSWRWIFVINAPIAVLVWWITRRSVKESFGRSSEKIDIVGALLVTASLGSIIYGLIAWGEGRSGPIVWGSIALGSAIMVAFLWVEARSPNAMLPLHFFRNRTFSAVNAMTLFIYTALAGLLYFLPFNLIQVQQWEAWKAGVAFLPFSLIMFWLARYASRMADRYGPRLPLTLGSVLTGLGFFGFGYVPHLIPDYFVAIALATLVMSVGMAMVVPPLTTVAMTSVDEAFAGTASGINNAVARLANLIGVAIFTVIALRVFDPVFAHALEQSGLATDVVDQLRAQTTKLAGIELDPEWDEAVQGQARVAINEAFSRAFEWTCYAAAA